MYVYSPHLAFLMAAEYYILTFLQLCDIWVISFSTDVARTKNHVERFSLEYSSLKKWDYQVTLYVVSISKRL